MRKLTTVKNHVVRNRTRYLVAGSLTAIGAYTARCAKEWHEFFVDPEQFDLNHPPKA